VKKFLLIPLAIVLVTALIFGGCRPVTEVPKEILAGHTIALTGHLAGTGAGGGFGTETAVNDINTLGGVYVEEYGKKLPIKLITLNDESDPIKNSTLAEDLILRDKIHVMVCSMEEPHLRAPVVSVTERHHIPHITGVGPWEAFIEVAPSLEYTWVASFAIAMPCLPGDYREGKPGYTMMGTWQSTMEEFAPQTNKKVAAFASDEPDGRGWYLAMVPVMQEWGLDVYGAEEQFGLVPPDTIDFTPVLTEWMANDCQLLWGNCPSPFYATMMRQAFTLGFQPKMAIATRAGLFYTDVSAWGGNIPRGVCNEIFWHPSIQGVPGFGDRTPMSLLEAWTEETGLPLNQFLGVGYAPVQIMVDAIERAGTLDADAISRALEKTDLMTMYHRVVYDENHFSRYPVAFGQWVPTDPPVLWKNDIVYSAHEFMPATAEIVFPIPYD